MEKFIKKQKPVSLVTKKLTPLKEFIHLNSSEEFVTLEAMAEAIGGKTVNNVKQHLEQLRIDYGIDYELRGTKEDREFKTWVR